MIHQRRTALLAILAIAVVFSVTPAEANQCEMTATPGPVNGDIFAAFNRTIQFHPGQVGQSVARVELTLCDS